MLIYLAIKSRLLLGKGKKYRETSDKCTPHTKTIQKLCQQKNIHMLLIPTSPLCLSFPPSARHMKRLFNETIFAPFVGNFAVAHGECHWAKWRVCRCAIQTETSLWTGSCFVTPGRGLFQKKMKEKRCLKINCARHWAWFLLQIGDLRDISSQHYFSKLWDHCHLQHLLHPIGLVFAMLFLVWESNPSWWLNHPLETIIVKVYQSLDYAPS